MTAWRGIGTTRGRSPCGGLGLSAADVVFVAGSTMDGEEVAALAAYRAARLSHPGLRLIVVPRHAERFEAVAARLRHEGETVIRRSRPEAPRRRIEAGTRR